MMFSTHKQKFPSKNLLLGLQCRNCVYCLCSAAIRFCCASH